MFYLYLLINFKNDATPPKNNKYSITEYSNLQAKMYCYKQMQVFLVFPFSTQLIAFTYGKNI